MTPAATSLSERERIDWLQLSRSQGIGPRTFLGLLQRFGSAAAAIDALPALARRRSGVRLASRDGVLREFAAATKLGLSFIALDEPGYPPALRMAETAPPVLVVRGDPVVLQRTMVAIVGSRNASGPGLIFTERLAAGLGAGGYVIVSGLARGIDVQAHRATLTTGTVAVLAGAHDRIYPPEHTDLAARIAEGGAVVSEMPLGWEPRGQDFPRRNRLVSGLAMATVVVEAARRSGSLITARFAGEQGREVFAVPGSPLDPRAEGTNDLLRQGASLCTSAEDVIEALQAVTRIDRRPAPPSPGLFEDEGVMSDDDPVPDERDESHRVDVDATTALLRFLGPSPMSVDDLIRLSGFGAAQVRASLLDLELDGVVLVEAGSVTRLDGMEDDPGR